MKDYKHELQTNFAKRLRGAMGDADVTQVELGKRIGSTMDTIKKYLYGTNIPNLIKLCEIAEALNVTPNDLLGVTND